MNAWIQIRTAVLGNSVSVQMFQVITPVNARMDCSTSTTLARVRKNIIFCHSFNHKNYNFLACDWFKKVLFSNNSLANLLSDSLLLDSLLLDSLLSDSSISQSHSKM